MKDGKLVRPVFAQVLTSWDTLGHRTEVKYRCYIFLPNLGLEMSDIPTQVNDKINIFHEI